MASIRASLGGRGTSMGASRRRGTTHQALQALAVERKKMLPHDARAMFASAVAEDEEETAMIPDTILLGSTMPRDQALLDLLSKFWKLPTPDAVFVIMGFEDRRTGRKPTRDKLREEVENVFKRLVLKRKKIWVVTSGSPESEMGKLLGKIATEIGFKGRDDLSFIGIQSMLIDRQDDLWNSIRADQPDTIGKLEPVVDGSKAEEYFNRNIERHLVFPRFADDSTQHENKIYAKMERLLRLIDVRVVLINVEQELPTDTSVLLHYIRRENKVVLMSAKPEVALRLQAHRASIVDAVAETQQTFLAARQAHENSVIMTKKQSRRLRKQKTAADVSIHERSSVQTSTAGEWGKYRKLHPENAELVDCVLKETCFHLELSVSHQANETTSEEEEKNLEHFSIIMEKIGLSKVNPYAPPISTNTRRSTLVEFRDGRLAVYKKTGSSTLPSDDERTPELPDYLTKSAFTSLMRDWGLGSPHLLQCVLGGLEDSRDLNDARRIQLENILFHGVARVSTEHGGWILGSGESRPNGLERVLGDATAACESPPVVLGAISVQRFDEMTPKDDDDNTADGMRHEKTVGSQAEVALNSDISHLLVINCDNDELEREAWETGNMELKLLKSLASWYNNSVPIYTVLIGGNESALADVAYCLHHDITVFAIEGTGGLADVLVRCIKTHDEKWVITDQDAQPFDAKQVARLIRAGSPSFNTSTPIWPIQSTTHPNLLFHYMSNLYRSHTSLTLADRAIEDRGLVRVSRHISCTNLPHECKLLFDSSPNGRLRFEGTGTLAPFVALESRQRRGVVSILEHAWNLKTPRLVISVTGGAGFKSSMKTQTDACTRLLSEGLCPFASEIGAWLVSGGTHAGVMKMLGSAYAESKEFGTLTLLGVAAFGLLKQNGHMATCRGQDVDLLKADIQLLQEARDLVKELEGAYPSGKSLAEQTQDLLAELTAPDKPNKKLVENATTLLADMQASGSQDAEGHQKRLWELRDQHMDFAKLKKRMHELIRDHLCSDYPQADIKEAFDKGCLSPHECMAFAGGFGDKLDQLERIQRFMGAPHFDNNLNGHHTHFVLANNCKWGSEISLRAMVEEHIVKHRVQVVVGGGPGTWDTVMASVRAAGQVPLILIKGLGGASETIADCYEEWVENKRQMSGLGAAFDLGAVLGRASKRTSEAMPGEARSRSGSKASDRHSNVAGSLRNSWRMFGGQAPQAAPKSSVLDRLEQTEPEKRRKFEEIMSDAGEMISVIDVNEHDGQHLESELWRLVRELDGFGDIEGGPHLLSAVASKASEVVTSMRETLASPRDGEASAHAPPVEDEAPPVPRWNMVLPLHTALIQRLDLGKNGITDKGVEQFSSFLGYNESLVEVKLNGNLITSRGCESLAKALIPNKVVRVLDISDNACKPWGSRGIHLLDSVAFSRLVTCDFGPAMGVGLNGQRQTFRFYAKWREELRKCVDEARKSLRERYKDEAEADEKLWASMSLTDSLMSGPEKLTYALAFPIHHAVAFPDLIETMLEELTKQLEEIRPYGDDEADKEVLATHRKSDKRSRGHNCNHYKWIKEVPDMEGDNILHQAIEAGYVRSVQVILENAHFRSRFFRQRDKAEDDEDNEAKDSLTTGKEGNNTVYDAALEGQRVCENAVNVVQTKVSAKQKSQIIERKEQLAIAESIVLLLNDNRKVARIRRSFAFRHFTISVSVYLMFLILGTFVAFHSCGRLFKDGKPDYMMKTAVQKAVTFSEDGLDDTFNDQIYDIQTLKGWMQGPLLNAFENPDNPTLAAVRIRQLRVKQGDCEGSDELVQALPAASRSCWPNFREGDEQTAPLTSIDLSPYPLPPERAGRHHHDTAGNDLPQQLKGGVFEAYWTSGSHYPGSGYVIDVPAHNRTLAEQIMAEIAASSWIDKATRTVSVDFTAFSPVENVMVNVNAVVELPATGGAFPYIYSMPIQLDKVKFRSMEFWMQVVFLFWGFLYFCGEIVEISTMHLTPPKMPFHVTLWEYVQGAWNIVDVLNVVLLTGWVGYHYTNYAISNDLVDSFKQDTLFHSSYFLAENTQAEHNVMSFVMLFYWLKLFKYVVLAPGLGPVVEGLVATAMNTTVIIFAAVLLIVLVTLSIAYAIAFGVLTYEYHTLNLAVLNVGFATVGELFTENFKQSPTVSPVFTYLVLFVASILILNIFIAVIFDVYNEEKERCRALWDVRLTRIMIDSRSESTLKRMARIVVSSYHKYLKLSRWLLPFLPEVSYVGEKQAVEEEMAGHRFSALAVDQFREYQSLQEGGEAGPDDAGAVDGELMGRVLAALDKSETA